MTVLAAAAAGIAPAASASATSATFTGGAGTVGVGGTLYAKSGAALTLTVTTSSDTQCVDVAGAFTGHQTSDTAKSTWRFTTTAGSGDGAQAITATASEKFNKNGACTGSSGSAQASYTLDNTGPVVTAALAPAANAAGWNKTDTTVTWTATDAGSGVASGPTPASSKETANGIVTRTSAATDKLGNVGNGSVTVRVDKAAPTITAAQAKNADGTTTVTFTCADSNSGGGDASGIASCLADGSATNSKTVQPGVTVAGTATDDAGNTSTATSTAPAGDTTAPTLSGAPTTSPNDAGWYAGDVTVRWTAADPESGIPTAPANTTITGEGKALTSTTTVTNGAGLSTTASSSPAVNIDRTAPTTGISGTSNDWTNGDVTVSLSATDNLSTVAKTEYRVDGGAAQTGTSFALSTEGDHTVTFFSTDKAGNAEAVQTAHVKIDKTAPTISHAFTPLSYADGAWTNQDVTVTFTCADQGGSGVAGCTAPVAKTAEGSHTVTGTATDGAGNTATDSASVRIDKTAPTITAAASGTKNAAGWYRDDVTVTYTANDELSGVSGTPAADVLAEGANQSASATVTDAAGNSASAGVTGINVDTTAPVLTGTFAGGWHTGDVTVDWSCTDALSGPAGQPADDVVTGEGDNLSSTTSCTDVAGNTATETVTGIKIDRSAPTTTAEVPGPLASGWYGDAVRVALTGNDNLSGIAATYYAVDGGARQTYAGAFSFGTEGTHAISFWSEDVAGNVETAGAPLTLKIDTTAPTTTVVNPVSPDSGWFVTSGIPVAFDADDTGSGIAATYYTIDGGATQTYGQPFTANLSTGTHTISYWSVDLADNVEAHATTNTIEVKVDTIAPTISIESVSGPAYTDGATSWHKDAVQVAFTASDNEQGSGLTVDSAAAVPFTRASGGQGTGISVSSATNGSIKDVAGNVAADVTAGPYNVDATAPVNAVTGVAQGGFYTLGAVPTAACATTDASPGSGVATSATVAVTGGSPTVVGRYTATCSGGADRVGHAAAAASVTYTVGYAFSGYFQPINDPTGSNRSDFKLGSTIPVKFALADSTGARIPDATAQAIADSCRATITATLAPGTASTVDEPVDTTTATTGKCFRYDPLADQFVFNFSTKGLQSGKVYNLNTKVLAADNTTVVADHNATVGLR